MSLIARLRTARAARTDRGASAVEYALIVTLVGGLVLIVTLLGQKVVANFATVANCYDNTCPASSSSSSAPAVASAPTPAASSSAPAPAPSPSSTRTRSNNGGDNNTGSNNNGGGNNTGSDNNNVQIIKSISDLQEVLKQSKLDGGLYFLRDPKSPMFGKN